MQLRVRAWCPRRRGTRGPRPGVVAVVEGPRSLSVMFAPRFAFVFSI